MDSLAEMYETCEPKIRRYVLRHVHGNTEMAEDITSEVFMRAIEHLDAYEERDCPFTSWLYRIAHNAIIDHWRRQARADVVTLDAVIELASQADQTGHVLNAQLLESGLAHLTLEQRAVIVLRFLEDRSVAETAARMHRSQDAIKQLQRRALVALRDALLNSGEAVDEEDLLATRAA